MYGRVDGFIDDVEFRKIIKETFEYSSYRLMQWQDNFKKCVDFVYNLNGNEELKDKDVLSKFIAYTIADNDLYEYAIEIDVILDNYCDMHEKYHSYPISSLIEKIENKNPELELRNVYTSTKLTSMCFAVLDQIVRQENLQIKTCLNCGRYFIPTYRQNEIYCDLPNVDGSPTCRIKGANEQYKKNLENSKALALYRRIYQQKFMIAYRNTDDKELQKAFSQWKKEAGNKVKQYKQGKLDEETLYKWLVESKE